MQDRVPDGLRRHVFIAAITAKHRLAELLRYAAPSILASTAALEKTPVDPFFNANRPEDLATAEALLVRADIKTEIRGE